MKLQMFNDFLTLFSDVKKTIETDLCKKFNLVKYKDKLEIDLLTPYEGFQSDCDGDDNHITCFVDIKIKTAKAQKLFEAFLKAEGKQDNVRRVTIKQFADVLYGDHYTFEYDYYSIGNPEG